MHYGNAVSSANRKGEQGMRASRKRPGVIGENAAAAAERAAKSDTAGEADQGGRPRGNGSAARDPSAQGSRFMTSASGRATEVAGPVPW